MGVSAYQSPSRRPSRPQPSHRLPKSAEDGEKSAQVPWMPQYFHHPPVHRWVAPAPTEGWPLAPGGVSQTKGPVCWGCPKGQQVDVCPPRAAHRPRSANTELGSINPQSVRGQVHGLQSRQVPVDDGHLGILAARCPPQRRPEASPGVPQVSPGSLNGPPPAATCFLLLAPKPDLLACPSMLPATCPPDMILKYH